MIDVILLDLDGTLLRSDGTISVRSIDTLKKCKAAGKRIVVATARAPRMAKLLPRDLRDLTWICCVEQIHMPSLRAARSGETQPIDRVQEGD